MLKQLSATAATLLLSSAAFASIVEPVRAEIRIWKGSRTEGAGPSDAIYKSEGARWEGDGTAWKGSRTAGAGPADAIYKNEGARWEGDGTAWRGSRISGAGPADAIIQFRPSNGWRGRNVDWNADAAIWSGSRINGAGPADAILVGNQVWLGTHRNGPPDLSLKKDSWESDESMRGAALLGYLLLLKN